MFELSQYQITDISINQISDKVKTKNQKTDISTLC